MKKILLLILCLALAVSMAALMTACGDDDNGESNEGDNGNGNNDSCSEGHYDSDNDGVCNLCNAEMPKDKIAVSFTVKDQDGNPIGGVEVKFASKTDKTYIINTEASGADGKIVAELKYGNYDVSYDYDTASVGYYFIETYSVAINDKTESLDLILIDNTPNGTKERPYHLNAGENSVELDAGKTEYFIVYHTVNLYVVIDGDGIKVTYNNEEKAPENDGFITFDLIGEDTNSSAIISIENKTSEKVSFEATVNSKLGTQSNPVVIDTLDTSISTENLAFEMVYFKYVATESGTFSVKLTSEKSSIRLQNNVQTADSANDADENGVVSVSVNAGDVVVIDCSAIDENPNDNVVPVVTFIPSFTPAE